MGEDYIDQLMSSGQGTTMDDIVRMTTDTNAPFWEPSNYGVVKKDGFILDPIYGTDQSGHGEEGQMYSKTPVYGVRRYKEGSTFGDSYEQLDPITGKVIGKGVLKENPNTSFFGGFTGSLKKAAADLGPILQFTPLAPFVRAINALSAAEQGNILGALASGLPLADKIPGLDKATVSALQSAGKYAAVASAAKSKDPMQLLNALSQTKEFGGEIPKDLKTIGGYIGKAGQVSRAIKGDPSAILGLATGAARGNMSLPKEPGVKTTDATTQQLLDIFGTPQDTGRVLGQVAGEIPSGMFDTNEGGSDDDYGDLPSWALDPYGTTSDAYYDSDPTQEKYAEEDRLLGKYPAPASIIDPKTSMSPQEMSRFLEANIDDPAIIDSVMQEYFPDLYMQSINVTGTIPNQGDITAPRSIRDIGTVTTISPDEKLEGTTIQEPDLSVGLPVAVAPAPAPRAPAPAPRAPAPAPRSPAPSNAGSGLDLSALFAMMGAMANQQQPTRTATGTSLARGTPESPFGLMYKLRG